MKKNKILIFLGCLIVLLFILLFSNKEGMEVKCKYQYLSPNQINMPLDDKTINDFILLYNANMTQLGAQQQFSLNKTFYDLFFKSKLFCTEEVNYYIQNKSFPINEYVMKEISNNKIKFPPFNRDTFSYAMSARWIFSGIIIPSYPEKSQPPDFKEAQAIYNGANPEPACAAPDVDVADNTPEVDDAPTAPTPAALASDSKTYACNAACNNACNNDSSFKYNS